MKEDKRKELARILPLAWNSYQHMYDVRVNRIQNITNFLLVIISFLSLASINFIYSENKFFFFPLILQLLAFLFLVKGLRRFKFPVHWFEIKKEVDKSKKDLLDNLSKDIFEEDLLADLKAIEDDSWIYIQYMKKIIKISLRFILSSLYFSGLILIVIYLQGVLLYLAFASLTLTYLCFYFWYKIPPKYEYEKNYKKYREQIEKWLKSNPKS